MSARPPAAMPRRPPTLGFQKHSPMVRVIPFVGRDDLLLGGLQVVERLAGMSTKLDPSVGGLGLLNVMNCAFRGAIRIPQIGMMYFISQSDRRYENCTQRNDDNLFHDFPLQLANAISAAAASILDNPTDGHSQRACAQA